MTLREVKEQLQEDVLSILEGFGIDEAMEGEDFENLVAALSNAVIANLNSLEK